SRRSQSRGLAGTTASIDDCLFICFESAALAGHLFIKLRIEENNLPRKPRPPELVQLLEIIDHNNLGRESLGSRGNASAQRGQYQFLSGACSLPGKLYDFAGFGAPDPVRNRYRLKAHFKSQTL